MYVWADGIHLNIRLEEAKAFVLVLIGVRADGSAVKKITDDEAELLAFYGFPAEHWIHLRTTNLIESTFATVRLRTKVTRGAGSRTAAPTMVFKLVESAQAQWRAVNAATSSNVPKPAWHERAQPIRRSPPMDPGHGRGKRARGASMQVSRDVGPPNRRRS